MSTTWDGTTAQTYPIAEIECSDYYNKRTASYNKKTASELNVPR
jgi:hypothetical protein